MNSNEDKKDLEVLTDDGADDSVSVDDFIRQLEAKEKDLHITAETTIIEIEQGFDDGNPSAFFAMKPAETKSIEPVAVSKEPAVEPEKSSPDTLSLQFEISELRDKIAFLEEERAEILLGAQRRSKDFDTFKARTERERIDLMEAQVCELASQLLPALDNLHRAIAFVGDRPDERSEEFGHFFSGMVLVEQQVMEILADMGIEPIPAVGESFDPHLHEAVATELHDELPPNTVLEELLRGYRVGERIIRHSMVKVAAANGVVDTEPADDDNADEI